MSLTWIILKQSGLADKVVRATLLEEVEVYKEKIENTGFSIGYSWRSYYRYKKVFDHYECTFILVYEDGKTGIIKCKKGSKAYYELMQKSGR